MEWDYQCLYPEGDFYGLSDYADQAISSSGREDLQGIMDPPPPVPTAFSDLYSIHDFAIPNAYQQYPMTPAQPDTATNLYFQADDSCNTSFRNDLLLNPSVNQDAWNPLRVTGVSQSLMPDVSQAVPKRRCISGSDGGIHPSEKAFSDVGSQRHTEEPPDSGYGTRSVATGSVIAHFNTDDTLAVQSHRTHINDRSNISFSEYNFDGDRRSLDLLSQAGSDHQGKVLVRCGFKDCTWTGKTESDKRKHETRHVKPFKCDVEGCTRKEGFGTKNDLERHQGSCHGKSRKFYKCAAEDCRRKDKLWPRTDNFRQHLRRSHGEFNVDELMKKSIVWCEPKKGAWQESPESPFTRPHHSSLPTMETRNLQPRDSIPSTPGLGPWSQGNIKEQAEGYSVIPTDIIKDSNMPTSASAQNLRKSPTTTAYSESNTRCRQWGYSQPSTNTSSIHRRWQSVSSPRSRSKSVINSTLSLLPSDSLDDEPTKRAMDFIEDLRKLIGTWDERRQDAWSRSSNTAVSLTQTPRIRDDNQNNNNELQQLIFDKLRQFGYQPENPEVSQSEISTSLSSAGRDDQQGVHQCSICGKKLDKKCKLKKHMKRHNRPYACTFPDCPSQPFGSKNDWKRHENSQHFQLQCWRCHIKSATSPSKECNRLFYRREKFIAHLDGYHKVTKEPEIRAFLKTDEIGRNGQSRFWCGFCREIITLKNSGMKAWNERFDHIDEWHFKKGENIATWQHPEIHRSDSSVSADDSWDTGRKGDEVSRGDEPIGGDNSVDSEFGRRKVGRPGTIPAVRISSEQANYNEDDQHHGTTTGSHAGSFRPRLRRDTSLSHFVAQTQKRKFTAGPATASAITQSRSVSQDPNTQFMALTNMDNPSSVNTGTNSAVSSQTNTTHRGIDSATAAALFPTMYPAKQKKCPPSEIFSCCHCSHAMVKPLTDKCVQCGHQACRYCVKGPPLDGTLPT